MPGNLNLKKSWNPALVKNQEKLWVEEQNKLNEYKRIKERNEELKEEREKLQLLKLQYGEDLKGLPAEDKLKMNKLNWMYEDPTGSKEPGFNEMNEEFLLGKKQVENMLKNNKSFKVDRTNRLESVMKVGAAESSKKISIDDPLEKIRREKFKQKFTSTGGKPSSQPSRSDYPNGRETHDVSERHRSRSRHSRKKHYRNENYEEGSHRHGDRGSYGAKRQASSDRHRDRSPTREKQHTKLDSKTDGHFSDSRKTNSLVSHSPNANTTREAKSDNMLPMSY